MLFGRKTASESAQEAAAAPGASAAPSAPSVAGVPTIEHKKLGQLLIDEGLVTSGQLEKALEEQARTGAFLGQVLVAQGAVTQAAVSSCLVKQCKIPHLSLLDYEISQDVLALIPQEVCQRFHLLPIDKMGRILTVAMVDPLDTVALETIRQHCGELKIKPILCNWEHYELVSSRLWSGDSGGKGTPKSMTAESLGLRTLPPSPKPTDSSPTPIPNATATSLSGSGTQIAPPASGMSSREMSDTVRESVRDAMSDAVRTMASQAAPAAPAPGVSGEDISRAIRGAMQEAVQAMAAQQPQAAPGPDLNALGALLKNSVQEAVSAVAQELRASAAVNTGAPVPNAPASDMNALGAVLRQSVQEAVSAVAQEMQKNAPAVMPSAAASAQISTEQMAAVIQESVGGAMQEAMALMMTQFKAMAPRREEGQAEALAGAVRESVREVLATTMNAQHEQGDRLAQIAEATLQSVQQTSHMLEAASVSRHTKEDLDRSPQGRHASVSPFRGGASGTMDHDVKVTESLESHRPVELMNFENFVPGTVNAFTFKVCEQIAAKPGAEFNPFFLFGHVGAGKTHLISAIGNRILKSSPLARVGYVSASHFARRMREAMTENALDAFRENYAHWDVLILDDIQFLAGRVEAQEEFFHIFNALHQQGRQIIIASDKAPDRLGQLEQRLISRFASGIVSELKAPEWEARMAILRQQAKESGVNVPEPVMSLIAMRVSDDVRKMTGSLRKILAYAQLVGKEISCEMAEEILSHLSSVAAA